MPEEPTLPPPPIECPIKPRETKTKVKQMKVVEITFTVISGKENLSNHTR